MNKLIQLIKKVSQERTELPFSVYTSIKTQHILNVPIIKPMLIFVLDGSKKLGTESEIICPAGNFIFLSNNADIDMRNIPNDKEYFALLIEFDYQNFDCFEPRSNKTKMHFQGPIESVLESTISQFIEWSAFAPSELWSTRRQEILKLLYHLGFKQVCNIAQAPSLSHKIFSMISDQLPNDIQADALSSELAMSESTLRRKLASEGTSLQVIKDKAKLGLGLHLIQTTLEPIGLIAEQCSYQSQSRFTDKFKALFGITPTDLRKTRMHDLGE